MLAGCESIQGGMKRGLFEKANDFEPKGKQRDVFGDGKASEKLRR